MPLQQRTDLTEEIKEIIKRYGIRKKNLISKRSIEDNLSQTQNHILDQAVFAIEQKAKDDKIVSEDFSLTKSSPKEIDNLIDKLESKDKFFMSNVADALLKNEIIEYPAGDQNQEKVFSDTMLIIQEKAKEYSLVESNFNISQASSATVNRIMRELEIKDSNFVNNITSTLESDNLLGQKNSYQYPLRDLSQSDYIFVTKLLNISNQEADNITLSELSMRLDSGDKNKKIAILNVLQEGNIISNSGEQYYMLKAYETIRNNYKQLISVTIAIAAGLGILEALRRKYLEKSRYRTVPGLENAIEMGEVNMARNNDLVEKIRHENEILLGKIPTTNSHYSDADIDQFNDISWESEKLSNKIYKLDNASAEQLDEIKNTQILEKSLDMTLTELIDRKNELNIIKEVVAKHNKQSNNIVIDTIDKLIKNIDECKDIKDTNSNLEEVHEKLASVNDAVRLIIDEIRYVDGMPDGLLGERYRALLDIGSHHDTNNAQQKVNIYNQCLKDFTKCKNPENVQECINKKNAEIEKINSFTNSVSTRSFSQY